MSELPDPRLVGRTLRRWRQTMGDDLATISAVVGRSEGFVDDVETGDEDLTLRQAVVLAGHYGVSIEALRFDPIDLLRAFAAGPAARAIEEVDRG